MVAIKIQYPWRPQACPDCKVFGHGSATCPRRVGENKLGIGDTRGPNRKAVVSNNQCWQVVGALHKETGAGNGNGVLGSLGTCPNAPASTSDPDGALSRANGPIVHAEVGQQVSGAELIVPPAEVVGLTPRKVSSYASHISPKFGAGVLDLRF